MGPRTLGGAFFVCAAACSEVMAALRSWLEWLSKTQSNFKKIFNSTDGYNESAILCFVLASTPSWAKSHTKAPQHCTASTGALKGFRAIDCIIAFRTTAREQPVRDSDNHGSEWKRHSSGREKWHRPVRQI